MNKNDIVRLKIDSITNEGMGVGRINGFVVFVPFAAVGDVIEVKLLKITKSCAYGKLMSVTEPSADRISYDCESFGKCGGCAFRHLDYQAELKAKHCFVADAFSRIGKFDVDVLPIIGSENVDRYRNKAQYPLGRNADGEAIYGFYAGHSHRIVPCEECKLHPPVFTQIADFILDFIRKNRLSVYDETKNEGVLRHICIREGHYSKEINVTIVARRKIPELMPLARLIMKQFPAVNGVCLNLNKDNSNVIFGGSQITLAGTDEITDKMCGLDIKIAPLSFYQVNTAAAEKLYEIAAAFASPAGKTILDLYCGTGTIGLSMAKEAKKVIGIEIIPDAIKNAVKNAEANGVDNAEFYCGDVGETTAELTEKGVKPDVIVLDPARKGMDDAAVQNVIKLSPDRIVMVSCNPATAARDCAKLAENGYSLNRVQPVDMFPRTVHVECVALLSKCE